MAFYRLGFGSYGDFSDQPLTDKNIVLDLDETLIHTFIPEDTYDKRSPNKKHHGYSLRDFDFLFNDNRYYHHKSRLYLLDIEKLKRKYGYDLDDSYWGFYRPNLMEFISFCKQYFNKVIVWTAGVSQYGIGICDLIFDDHCKPDLILTRDDCETYNRRISKPLDKLYDHPDLKGILTPENTLIIDDRKSNFYYNPNNGITIEPFDPEKDNIPIKKWLETPDNRLMEIKDWLMQPHVMYSRDVRTLNKNGIFK